MQQTPRICTMDYAKSMPHQSSQTRGEAAAAGVGDSGNMPPQIYYVPNKYAVIKRTGNKKKVLHVWIWIRESPKWWLLMILNGWASQLKRNLIAAIRYAEENDFELVIHGVFYAEQVSRREVHESIPFADLLVKLMHFRLDHESSGYVASGDKLWLLTTEYLRFGEDPIKVGGMCDIIEKICVNGVYIRVVTLKEFELNRDSCLLAWRELEDNLRDLAENASNRDPAKLVPIDQRKKKEREDVERDATEIENHLREHNSLPEADQQNTKFYRSKKVDIEKLTKRFIEAQEQIGKSEKLNHQKVKDAVSSIWGDVNSNMQLLKSPTGGMDIAMYFRSSHGTSVDKATIELEDGGGTYDLPLQQFAHNMAMIRQLQRQDEEIRVWVFYDDQRSRDSLCNPEFCLFLHGVLSQHFSSAVVSQWNRISTHLEAFDILQELCSTREVSLLFSKEIGQDSREVAITENKRRDLQREFVARFNKRMDEIRDGMADESKKQISLQYLKIGMKQFATEDKDELIEFLRESGLNDDFIKELDETAKLASEHGFI